MGLHRPGDDVRDRASAREVRRCRAIVATPLLSIADLGAWAFEMADGNHSWLWSAPTLATMDGFSRPESGNRRQCLTPLDESLAVLTADIEGPPGNAIMGNLGWQASAGAGTEGVGEGSRSPSMAGGT